MFTPINEMAKTSRVWVYQANPSLTETEEEVINMRLKEFVNSWAAHGQPLSASFDIRYGHFLILFVDESNHGASGCSIDSSVQVVKDLGSQLNIDFFDRSSVAILANDKIELHPLSEVKSLILQGEIVESSITFNNLVEDIESLEKHWTIPAGSSWLKRFFNVGAMSR